ncbi:MAG: CBS domain-containing protein [Cellvibrionaceae bacterium]|nr:CBS domain-containing protein [Cellvibrionaceae bacterium]MCV6625851.1 CBS domain-containing protein [Cellvibrionaceae bacterium]
MSEDPSSSQSNGQDKSWLERFFGNFSSEPNSREELLAIIKEAAERELLDSEALSIIEGALDVADQQVREVLIPRPQMVVLNIDDSPEQLLPKVIESGHSRFPVIGESVDDIKGILLAKDLLPLILGGTEHFELNTLIRPAVVIPESKRLNVLLREFRENRYHMAMVIDEYGGIAGLVTIEDLLEEIVGEIEDETDEEEEEAFIRQVSERDFIVKALTPIEEFNAQFSSGFSEDDFDTIGGIVMQAFGHLPSRNEQVEIDNLSFKVLYSDSRKIHLLRLTLPGND